MKKLVLILKSKNKHKLFSNDYLIGEFLLVIVIIILSILFPVFSKAQKAKDGDFSTASSTLVNKYVTLASSASAGVTSITVSNITHLKRTDATTPNVSLGTSIFANDALTPGDLVMIIQMQGADIATTDDANYGNITAYNNTGNYELKTVLSIASNTITFCDALTNSYGATGRQRTQVIRVPRFNNLTVNATHIISAAAWQGTKGGVCAIEVNGNLLLNGQIDVSGKGFRGGIVANSALVLGITNYRSTADTIGALKGESIAGNSTDYNTLNGAYGRGAPANGGGGGDNHNSGGGGGSNAGNNSMLTPWNGTGIKSTSTAAWANAWNLESAGFATNISRGGGRGGYTFTDADQDALTVAPGNIAWNYDNRRNVGGFGGRPLDYSSNTRLFLGGGGGAGQENDGYGGSGGNGGGIAYLLVAGIISGSGNITAYGANGGSTIGLGNDAPGGGGGGGAVIALSNQGITGITINAIGGDGGNQTITGIESEGPGGGGGGGYIFTTTTTVTRLVTGGVNGTTNSASLTEFIPNGATKGDAGTVVSTATYTEVNSCFKEINGLSSPSCTYSPLTIASGIFIPNTYYPATASVSAGAIKINVGVINGAGSSTPISPGDLLLIIQMQGSTINLSNTSAYGGGGINYSGYLTSVAGTYEYVYASSGVISNTIYLTTPLRNNYTSATYLAGVAGQYTYQVIRVPEYSALTINAGATVTAAPWNGSSGGIVALNVKGSLTLGAGTTIDVSGKGFRGGGGVQTTATSTTTNNDVMVLSTVNANASKGEGIAGTPRYTFNALTNTTTDNTIEGYPNGSFAKGAPANAGGGGTDLISSTSGGYNLNCGGGGGSNIGAGGRGGRGFSFPSYDNGGYGGATFAAASKTRIILGGGGGAGNTNNATGAYGAATSSGAAGGGIILINTASVIGTSTIAANGATAFNPDDDGAGGGGAGESIYLFSTNSTGLANITISAIGGKGGDAWPTQPDDGIANNGYNEVGPGGGGGGGVYYTNGAVNAASSINGGLRGTTTTSLRDYFSAYGAVGIANISATAPKVPVKVYCDVDDDNDGIIDSKENPNGVEPFDDADNDGIPNVYDATSGTTVSWVDSNNDGINDNYDADKDGKINELDIDSDNDGITDNVEAQSTTSYKVPTDVDSDADGLNDAYEMPAQIGIYGGNGLTPVDTDGDGIPDFLDNDSDNDGVPDRNEGDRNSPFVTVTQTTIDASGDIDGDGLMDIFDNVNNDNLTTNFYTNVTMGNMGAGTGFTDNFNGPTPSGSLIGLQKSDPSNTVDRDWRNASILPLNILSLNVNYQSPFASIKWQVVNELQTDYYDVEFSLNAVDFVNIQNVSAKNTSNGLYSINQNISNYTGNIFYYRIKQVDKNAKVYYSPIATLRISKNAEITISPNPFKSYLNISYTTSIAELIKFSLLSNDGRKVAAKEMYVMKGANSIQIAELDKLPPGTYFLQIVTTTGGNIYKVTKL
jgi:hypothetical protein